ncbi:hypothetical protein BJX61DRAFT_546448 [Aspergillus egyptiacus]|nr:hypothetical protein BJX61DRAFT_546448 [Aspergillus egyptiacus]
MGESPGSRSPSLGPGALAQILEREKWNKFGFVIFRTSYRDEKLWQQFLEEYESLLRAELNSANPELLSKVHMEMVSDDCMDNKIPAHIALAYRLFDDIEPGLRTKMCLIVDQECMESVTVKHPNAVPFVKAVDVVLGTDVQSEYPRVIKVAISSLLARFYPALVNCDTVWEIASDGDTIWEDWPNITVPGALG